MLLILIASSTIKLKYLYYKNNRLVFFWINLIPILKLCTDYSITFKCSASSMRQKLKRSSVVLRARRFGSYSNTGVNCRNSSRNFWNSKDWHLAEYWRRKLFWQTNIISSAFLNRITHSLLTSCEFWWLLLYYDTTLCHECLILTNKTDAWSRFHACGSEKLSFEIKKF
jgi:hypothetical protein